MLFRTEQQTLRIPGIRVPGVISMKRFISSHKVAAGLLAVAGMLSSGAVSLFSQDASVTVTGLRSETDVNNIAASVDVITADEIEKSGKTSVTDVLESIAGVSLSGVTGAVRRGVSIGGYGDNAFGRVLVLIDGVPLNNPDMSAADLSSIQISTVRQIEVYKGDASALYGNQAVAGVISITTKEAGKKSAFVEGGASTDKTVFGTASAAASGDAYGLTVSATGDSERSKRENNDNYTGSASLSGYYDAADKLTVHSSIRIYNDRYCMPGSTSGRDSTKTTEPYPYAKDFGCILTVNPVWTFSDAGTITAPFAYNYKSTDSLTLYSAYNAGNATERERHQLTFRPDVSCSFGNSIRLYAGIDSGFENFESNYGTYTSFTALEDDADDKAISGTMKTVSAAPFARLTYVCGPVQLEGTGRFDYYGMFYTNENSDDDTSKRFTAPAWQASALYHVTDSALLASSLYVSGGSIFRYPFDDEIGSFYGLMSKDFNKDLEAETGYSVRTGYKGSFRAGSFDLYGGYSYTDNEIAYDSTDSININQDAINRYTAGISVKFIPADTVSVTAGYTYVDAEYADGSYEGNKVPLVSAASITGTVSVKPLDRLTLGSSVRVDSPYYPGSDFANTQDREPWSYDWAVNAALCVTKDFTLYASGNNLLEKAKADYVTWDSWSGICYYPCEGRSLTLKARISY